MNKRELFKPGDPPQIFRREIKPLRKDEYPSPKEIASLTGEVGKSRIKEAIGLALVSSGLVGLAVGCAREIIEPTPTVEPTEETGIPSPILEIKTPTPTPEIIPSPTVTVEAIGFGMEDLTPAEQKMVADLETAYRLAADNQRMREGTIILTHGDEEGEVGAYFEGKEGDFWSLVTREEKQILEKVPSYKEVSPTWNPNEMRFEAIDSKGEPVAYWNPQESSWEEVIPPTPAPTPPPEIQRVAYLEDGFAGTNKAVFEGPNPRFENDALYFTFAEEGGGLWARAGIPFSNFRLETQLSGNGAYGLTFGEPTGINYLLVLEKNGQLNLKKFKGEEYLGLRFNGQVITPSKVEGFHGFSLDYDGKRLILFFDGEEVGRVSEDLPGSGKLGLFVWNEPEKNVEVGIDYLAVKLPQELIPPTPTPAPPEPTETPSPPICEIPHFPERTPDRTTGFQIDVTSGKYSQIIRPEGIPTLPYFQWFNLDFLGIYPKVTKRDGRIIEIDRQNQIITFDIGGLIVKRRFTENTHVLMWAHELYRGMPMTEALKKGGNLCDLKVGDAAAILDPSEGVNPDLTDLWGVNIVQ